MLRLAITICVLHVLGSSAKGEKRVALVIGNGAYTHAPELANPRNDADDFAAALKALGVEVMKGVDLNKAAMNREVRKFSAALAGADVGIFFYSGHGLQVSGANYLVPVDAELSTADALDFEMVRLDLVQRVMENATKTNILFLDACRNNPLTRNLARALGTRAAGIGKGLAPAESGVGTLISFSTQPGNVALDGTGRNSPYTGPLVKRIGRPGEDVLTVLTDVRNEVLAATGDKQVPWENHALRARFYFNQAAQGAAPPQTAPPASQSGGSTAEREWQQYAKDTKDIRLLEAFKEKHKDDPVYARLAEARIEELKQATEAAKKKADEEAPAKAKADQQRQAMLQKQQEEERARTDAKLVLPTRTVSCTDQATQRNLAGVARTRFMTKCEACEKQSLARNYVGFNKVFFVSTCIADSGEPPDCAGLANIFKLAGAGLTTFVTKCEEAKARCETALLERNVEASRKNGYLSGCIAAGMSQAQ